MFRKYVFHVTYIEMEKRFNHKTNNKNNKIQTHTDIELGRNLTLKEKNLTTYIQLSNLTIQEVVYQM